MNTKDLIQLYQKLPKPDMNALEAVQDRAGQVLRPTGALERLDQIASWLAGWQRTTTPHVEQPAFLIAAADHGVTSRGVSAYPQEITKAMVLAIEKGVATSSVLARHGGATVHVVDAGVGLPTEDIVLKPAMTAEQFDARFQQGREAVANIECDLLAIGEMGIGNTTAAAAVAAATVGGEPGQWVGPGSGVSGHALNGKRQVVTLAVQRVGAADPMEVLRQLGGSEFAALAGAVVEARVRSIPVVIDGFISTAAVAPLEAAVPGALDHCMASHRSSEPGHGRLLDWLGKRPILDLNLRLGEGSGALLAIPLVRMAAAAVTEVATFGEWGLV